MKTAKYFKTLLVSCLALFAVSCVEPYDDTPLWEQIGSIEEQLSALQTVMKAYENNLFITKVTENANGYEIVFSDRSKALIYHGEPGAPGTPGTPGTDGEPLIESIVVNGDEVTFNLTDGTSFSIPIAAPLDITFDVDELIVGNYETVTFGYTVTSPVEKIQVEVVASSFADAAVISDDASGKTGSIQVTSYYTDEYSFVVIFVSDGNQIIMRRLTFEAPAVEISDNSTKEADEEGGNVTLEFLSNTDYEVVIPPDAQSWISVVEPEATTRAMEAHSVTLKIEPNAGFDRSATVSVMMANGDLGVEYTIEQTGEQGPDPFLAHHTYADLKEEGLTKADYLKAWNYYAVDGYGSSANRVYLGMVTITDDTVNDTADKDYLTISGLSTIAGELDTASDAFPVEYRDGKLYVSSDHYLGKAWDMYYVSTMFVTAEDNYIHYAVEDGIIGGPVADGFVALVPSPDAEEEGSPVTYTGIIFGAHTNQSDLSTVVGGVSLYEWMLLVDPAVDPRTKDLYFSSDYSQDGKVTVLQEATEGNGIDIVLMGDAYSDRQIADGTYEADMKFIYDKLFTEEPYATYKNLFNVYYVTAVSANEGYGEYNNTVFSGEFGQGTYVGGNNALCFDYALKAISDERLDEALIIVAMNSTAYAGTCHMFFPSNVTEPMGNGTSVAYFPKGTNADVFAILLHHEACGHGFAKLDDEYSYYEYGAVPSSTVTSTRQRQTNWRWSQNVDFTSDTSTILWSKFIADPRYASQGLGAYEGGMTYWTGVWRPTENSIMNNNTGGFNAPSREAIYYRIHKLAYGSEWTYDYETFVAYDAVNFPSSSASASVRAQAPSQEAQIIGLRPLDPPVVYPYTWRDAK